MNRAREGFLWEIAQANRNAELGYRNAAMRHLSAAGALAVWADAQEHEGEFGAELWKVNAVLENAPINISEMSP